MSTRCNIHFGDPDTETHANIYRHSDGYPDSNTGVLADMERFFSDVEKQCGDDTRFNDPEYLAAKFVVWQAAESNRTHNETRAFIRPGSAPAPSLVFLGVAPCTEDHEDIEFVYYVCCEGRSRPEVRWKRPGASEWSIGQEPAEAQS